MTNKTEYTPTGSAAWVKVYQADYEYKTVEGEFAVDLYLSPEDAAPIIKAYDKIVKDTIKKDGGKESPDKQYHLVSEIPDKHLEKLAKSDFNPDPTWYRFKFRNKEKVNPKGGTPFENKITVLDKAGQPLPRDTDAEIGNGSKLRVAYQPFGWCVSGKTGCKMRLVAVQVIEKNAYSPNGAVAFSAVEEEDIKF
jgi:hypothetical protein